MRKSPKEKAENRVWSFVNADRMEWQRLIENPELMREVKKIQRSYGLPVDTRGINHLSAKEVTDWMGWDEPMETNEEKRELVLGAKGLRRQRLVVEEKELVRRFGIPPKFHNSLHRMIIMDTTDPEIVGAGFPSFEVSKGENGEWIHQCIIAPTTDLDNPLVINTIKQWQGFNRDRIPQPQPMRGNAKQLDWRPVWEWQKRHPNVSDKEIAKMLNKRRETVSRALERLDKENPSQM